MLTFEQAQARIGALAHLLGSEEASLAESAGRVLAEDVRAQGDWPPFDASAMDGYAVRASEARAGASLPVIGESRTGAPLGVALPAGAACRIFTGAVLPDGADCVVMQESTRRGEDGHVTFVESAVAGKHVRSRGEDLAAGAVALTRGARLGPAHVSVAASLDRRALLVARRPRVVVLSTGDELRDPGEPGPAGSIPESNGVAIAEMSRRAGAIATMAPRTRDDLGETTRAVDAALEGADLLVTIGGVSVGDHDVVKEALAKAGVSVDFWKVSIKPGKPLALGTRGASIVLGLPGNPASAMVTFALFGVPLIRAMQGDPAPWPSPQRMPLGHDVTRSPGRLEFARARRLGASVTLVRHQASGAALGVALADCLAALPADAASMSSGTLVDVYPFSELCL